MIKAPTKKQHESIVNELKGGLFEYLVALQLAKIEKIEEHFLAGIDCELKLRLMAYEKELHKLDAMLFRVLPSLANKTARLLSEKFQGKSIRNVFLTGTSDLGHEGDLAIFMIDGHIPISLKLSRPNAFINTKSGGARSFLSKYFEVFSDTLERQQRLNQIIDQSFFEMNHKLYELAGLPCSGSFDESWYGAGYSDLPGEIKDEKMQQAISKFYSAVISEIYSAFEYFISVDADAFAKCLLPLLGINQPDLLQIICAFNPKTFSADLCLHDAVFFQKEITDIELEIQKKNITSFYLVMKSLRLQIRVKPMNAFTVPALKINCSISLRGRADMS